MLTRTRPFRTIIASLIIITISAVTATADWTDYINPFSYFTFAKEAASVKTSPIPAATPPVEVDPAVGPTPERPIAFEKESGGVLLGRPSTAILDGETEPQMLAPMETQAQSANGDTPGMTNRPDAVNNYSVARSTGISFSSISGTGTSVSTWRNGTSLDDNLSDNLPIGFQFVYNGGVYTNFRLSTNGFMTFNSTSSSTGSGLSSPYSYTNTMLASANAAADFSPIALAPMWDDLTIPAAGTLSGNAKYQTTGSAPSRILTVEWIGMEVFGNAGPDLNFQVKLYEADGHIEFVYGTMSASTATYTYSTGINAQSISAVPTAAELLTQQTANTATFNNTASSSLATVPAANTQLTFTPPVSAPAAPTGLNFTAIGPSGMTLNWTDVASTEAAYAIYQSTDNVNFTLLTPQPTANATSQAVTGLSPSTTYFFQVYAAGEGLLSTALTGSQATSGLGNISSVGAGGNWSATGTWVGGVVPTAFDNVTIVDGATVTIDTATAVAYSLTVGQGTSGVLQYDQVSARTLTVTTDVTVAAGGTFKASATGSTGTVTTHSLSVGGNMTNNGTVNFSTTAGAGGTVANAAAVGITFTGASTATFDVSNSAAVTNLKSSTGVTLNKGTTSASTLNFTPAITYQSAAGATNVTTTITVGSTTNLAPGMYVSVTSGTGVFAANATVSSVTNSTTFVVSAAPTTALSASAVVTASKFGVQSASALTGATAGFLSITNGTFKVNGSNTFLNPYFNAVAYSIPATGGFWLNNANATVTGQGGSPTNSGLLRITAGTMNVGTASGNSMGSASTSSFIFEGGTTNFTGRLLITSACTFTMSAGTINVTTVGNAGSSSPGFGLTSTTSTFTMSGGTINLVQASTGATPQDYQVSSTLGSISGGTLNVGTAATATNFNFRIQGAVPNLVVDNTTNAKAATLSAATTVYRNLTINTGASLNTNATTGFTLNMLGTTVTNNGSIVGTAASGRFDFVGTAAQTYVGSGTFGTAATPFVGIGVGISNTFNVTLSSPIVTTRVNLFAGQFVNSNQITIGSGAALGCFVQRGGGGTTAGTFDVAPTFNLGTGSMQVTYATATNAVTTSVEIPATRTLTFLTINNTNGVTLAGGGLTVGSGVTGTLTMTLGNLITSSSNLLTIGSTATTAVANGSTTSYVNGPMARTLAASLVTGSTFTFPIGKSTYNLYELVNPTTGAGGTLVVQAEAFDANSGGTAGTGISTLNTTRYWSASSSGAGSLTNTTVRLTESPTLTGNRLGQSATLAGTYNSIGNTVVSNTILSGTTTSLGFFNLGNFTLAGGTYSVCDGGTYLTLKSFFDAVNSSTLTGNIVVNVAGNCVETASAVLNQWLESPANSNYTMTINPSGSVARTITGAITAGSPLIDLNGADRVTINGLNDGFNTLAISNTTASSTGGTCTVRYINDATNNTLTNSTLTGSYNGSVSTTPIGGVVCFGTTTGTTGNDTNTVSNNNIGPAGANLPTVGVGSIGSTTSTATNNSGVTVSGNNISDYFGAAVTSAGVYFGSASTDNTVQNNKFFQTATRTQTTGAQHSAIQIDYTSGNNTLVSGNTIGFAASNGTGTYTLVQVSSSTFVPIFLNVNTTGTATSVQGNTIAGIAMSGGAFGTSTSAPFRGVYVSSGLTTVGNVTGNTIGSQSATGSITFTSNSGNNSDVYGMYNFSLSNWTSNNNTVGGITASNSSTGASSIYGLRCNTGTSVTWTALNNTVGGSVANSLNSTTMNTASIVQGFRSDTPIATLTSNTVQNMTAAGGTGTTTSTSVAGMVFVSTTPNNTLSRNTIANLSNSSATDAVTVTGIQYTASSGTNLVERNLIYNLSTASNSTSAEINGIRVAGGTTTYQNNMIAIGNATTNAIGTGTTAGINGINEPLGTDIFYNNSVLVRGAPTGGGGPSFAFNSTQTSNTRNFRNNIFYNARSNSGATGKNYAVRVGGSSTLPTGLTMDFNDYFANGSGAVFGFFNGADVASLAAWKTAVGLDAASVNVDPLFVAPTNATPDLHVSQSSPMINVGTTIAAVTNDYDNDSRPLYSVYDIGADEVVDITAPDTSITLSPANPTSSSSASFTFTGTDIGGSGLASFECKLDAGAFAACSSPQSYAGLTDGSHNFQVRAKDGAGNTDATPASFTWVVDTIAPDTAILTNPSDPTNSTSATFTFSGTDAGGTGVNGFQCQIDGGAYTPCTSATTYNSLTNGPHTFNVRAIDNAGNTDASPATFTWTIDTIVPDTTIVTNPSNPSNSSSATFTYSATGFAPTAVYSYECSLDAATFTACLSSGITYTGLADGSHNFQVRATDAAGNVDATPATYTWSIDTVAPVITPYTPLGVGVPATAQSFTVIASDNVALASVSVVYSVNGGAPVSAACVLNTNYDCTIPGLASGSVVTYVVTATDTAGNSTSSPTPNANLYTVGPATVPAGTYASMALAGGSSLSGDVTVTGDVALGGIINTGGFTLTIPCGGTISGASLTNFIIGNVQKVFCVTGSFTYPVGTTTSNLTNAPQAGPVTAPVTVNVTAVTSGSSLTVSSTDLTLIGLDPANSASRYWTITKAGTITADLSFTYDDADIHGAEASYKVFKRELGTTIEVTPNSVVPGTNTATVTGVSSFSDWGIGILAPTAAGATLGGRVLTSDGRGIRNAEVVVRGNSLPQPIRMLTGPFGYYSFDNLEVGETYVVSVKTKQFTFSVADRVVSLTDNIFDVDFTALPHQ